MPIELQVAIVGLVGALVGAAGTYIIGRRQIAVQVSLAREAAAVDAEQHRRALEAEHRLAIAAHDTLRQLLEMPQWKMRSFDAIKKHMGGFDDNELRKLLVAAGAVAFKGGAGQEYWGLLDRNADALRPSARFPGDQDTPPDLDHIDPCVPFYR